MSGHSRTVGRAASTCVALCLLWAPRVRGDGTAAAAAAAADATDANRLRPPGTRRAGKEMASNLKVGLCAAENSTAYMPYVQFLEDMDGKKTLFGFEVELFQMVYAQAVRILDRTYSDNSTEYRKMGNYFPDSYIHLPNASAVKSALGTGEIDVGFCALDQLSWSEGSGGARFDVLIPHIKTGLRMIIKTSGGDITLKDLIFQIFSSMQDPKAITAFLLLLIFAIIFGHVVWGIEREVNGPFHPRYGPGFIDGVWLCMVTATTVGYGDKVPNTIPGKVVMMIWMFLGCYIMSVFQASVTSNVVALRARGAENKLPCKSVDLLHLCSVAFSSEDAKNRAELLQQTKKTFTNPVINANHSDLLQKLMTEDNGQQDVDVVVMDAWTANYMVAVPKFRGKLVLHESTFSVGSLVMGVSRPEGRENPLFLLLQSAVFEVVHGAMMDEYAELIHKWFGQESVMDLAEYQARIQKAIVQTNIGISLCLGGVVLLWSAASIYYYFGQIKEEIVRKRFTAALSLGRSWTLHELRVGAKRLFHKYDRDNDEKLDVVEIKGLLLALGKEISIHDIKKYINMGRDFGLHKNTRKEDSILEDQSHAPKQKRDKHMQRTDSGGAGKSPEDRQSPIDRASPVTAGADALEHTLDSARSREGGWMQSMTELINGDDSDSEESDVEKIEPLTEAEFIRVIEGIILDEDSDDESDDEDLTTKPQRRHVISIAGTIEESVNQVDQAVKDDVHELQEHMHGVKNKLDSIIANLKTSGKLSQNMVLDSAREKRKLDVIEAQITEKQMQMVLQTPKQMPTSTQNANKEAVVVPLKLESFMSPRASAQRLSTQDTCDTDRMKSPTLSDELCMLTSGNDVSQDESPPVPSLPPSFLPSSTPPSSSDPPSPFDQNIPGTPNKS